MASKVYYDPGPFAGFSTLDKLNRAVKDDKRTALKSWLEEQDAFTLHRPVRKRFHRNPYTVTNVMDVWECDLLDMQAHNKVNDNYRYLLTVIDVFSKFLHIVPLKVKTGPAVTSAFHSIFKDPKYSRKLPVWVRTDKGKEFLNKQFENMLKHEKIQFQVCRNPDVKCAIVERVQKTLRDKIFKYFTFSNTLRYIDVLPKFVRAYNKTVHRSTGMGPLNVTDSDVLAKWKRMKEKSSKIRTAKPRLRVGQHVRITKAKMRFVKGVTKITQRKFLRLKRLFIGHLVQSMSWKI
jgi:transposase InsO family protein